MKKPPSGSGGTRVRYLKRQGAVSLARGYLVEKKAHHEENRPPGCFADNGHAKSAFPGKKKKKTLRNGFVLQDTRGVSARGRETG